MDDLNKNKPGQHWRAGLTLLELVKKFPDDEAAEAWFAEQRWGGKPWCPRCMSENVQCKTAHKSMPYRCRSCRRFFSVRTGTVMTDTKLGYQIWAIAIYLLTTSLKGVSSMKLHRDLGVTQKTAWHLAHRIRKTLEQVPDQFWGPVEADETYIGGKERNKPAHKRMKAAGGPAGKAIVAGVLDRSTGEIVARVVPDTSAISLVGMIADHTMPGAEVYTDEALGYKPLNRAGYRHSSVTHSISQWVDGKAHTNGMESFWSLLKRGYHGTYHHMSREHLNRYVDEFSGRHNIRSMDTITQMSYIARHMVGKQLQYKQLIGEDS